MRLLDPSVVGVTFDFPTIRKIVDAVYGVHPLDIALLTSLRLLLVSRALLLYRNAVSIFSAMLRSREPFVNSSR